MRRLSSLVVSVTLLLRCSPALAAEVPASPSRSYAIPCPPSELLRRPDALLALAGQLRVDLALAEDADHSPDAVAIRKRNTTLFQVAVLERDTVAAHRALERVRATLDAPAQKAISGLFTEPYLQARMSPGSDFHVAFRERMTRRLAVLPFSDTDFILEAVRGQMATASPDTAVGTARAMLDPLVQDGRIAAEAAATLIALAVNDELVRSVRADLLACLDATIAAHKSDAEPFAPQVGVLKPPIHGAWFGQSPPGHTPVRFASAILDSLNPWVNGVAFSPDGMECFLGIGGPNYGGSRIVHATCEAGVWTPFTPPPCLDGFIYTMEPHFSSDGRKFFFTGKRVGEFRRLWAVTRTGATWGAPMLEPAPIDGEGDAYRGSVMADGTWYFGLQSHGMVEIHRATPGGATGMRFEKLGEPINEQAYDGDPCVAPDGRWLIFNSARNAATGGADLYVSFPDAKGDWGTPIRLGPEFNSPDDEYGAMLTSDAKRLFYTRHTSAGNHIFTLDTSAIDALKPGAHRTNENALTQRHSMGTSAFLLGNLQPDSPDFVQLDYGYRLTRTDALLLEAITWKYTSPTGIRKASHTAHPRTYPGYVRSYGVSLAFQRFLWKELFARVHASSFLQDYRVDSADETSPKGYQLMFQFRLGYSLEFSWLGRRFDIDPNACCNYWPVNTHVPASFAKVDDGFARFAFEPGLNCSIRF